MRKIVFIKKLTETAQLPSKAYPTDACYDLYADENKLVNEHEVALVKTGLVIEIPEGYEGIIRPRSGMSKKGVHVNLGTIDSGYRGELKVSMILFGNTFYNTQDMCACSSTSSLYKIDGHIAGCSAQRGYLVHQGDRVAQLAIRKISEFDIQETSLMNDTDRSTGGFGSSGV